jgi:hypothetical protein
LRANGTVLQLSEDPRAWSDDVLPMLYAPQRGVELPERTFAPDLPLPAERELWQQAADAAIDFWSRAATDTRISGGFRQTCALGAAAVRRAAAMAAATA